MSLKPGSLYEFGPFRLNAAERTPLADGTVPGQRKAIDYFEQAVAIDPGYAAAYA